MAPSQSEPPPRPHWAVRMNWKNRSICFVLLGITVGSYFYENGASPVAWVLLGLQFFLYPHVLYWHGLRAANPRQAEVRNMTCDALCFGAWSAALGFPLWLSFSMFVGASVNLLVFTSWWGWARAIAGMCLGALWVLWALPWSFRPESSAWSTGLSMFTLMAFLAVFAQDGFLRATQLYQQRKQLQQQVAEIQALKNLLAEQATRDPQTGLFNRRMLDQKLPELMAKCAQTRTPLTVMLLDIDHFKQVNDKLGHTVGDQLLNVLSRHLMQYSRPQDLVFRYGGDEFLVLFPDTPLEVAHARAQQLCAAFASRTHRLGQGHSSARVTLSCGLASYPLHGHDVQSLLEHTDWAMYQAKAAGRNRVWVYGQAESGQAKPVLAN